MAREHHQNLFFQVARPTLQGALLALAMILIPIAAQCQAAPKISSLYVIDYGTSIGDTLLNPTGIFFDTARRELYVVDAGKKRILIYDDNGRFRSQIRLFEHFGLPRAMVVDEEGRIFLAPMYGSKIPVLDQNGKLFKTIDISEGFEGPKEKLAALSMVLGPDKNIYLLTTLRGVVRIDPGTLALSQINLEMTDEEGNPRLVAVLDMTVDGDGNFLFGEMRPGSVVVFDREGRYVTRFGESGGGPKQISRPTGITVDKEARIYVLSTIRDMVLVYDKNGRYLREWGGPGTTKGLLYSATRIIYNGRDKLYTVEPGINRVQAFGID